MNIKEVFQLLEDNKNQRGIDNWIKLNKSKLKSFGIGLTVLRKLAKKIGRDAELAAELWKSDNYDAKVISLLIDDPKTITREQAEVQVEQLEGGYLEHVYSSCDATLGKTDFVRDIIADWIDNGDKIRRSCAYGLLYELSKSKKKNAPDDEYFLGYLRNIESKFQAADKHVLLSMGIAVQGIGHRNKNLHGHALALAEKIGPIDFNEDGQKCDPFDVVKNLTSPYIVKKYDLKL
jgi:3-methyladenine DNA glycosylase AlkD